MRDPKILSKFSQKNSDSPVIFTGDECIVYILEKFENYGCLSIGDTVNTIGVFDMVVDGAVSGMFLVGRIDMSPSDVDTEDVNGVKFVKLTFRKGDVFMKTTNTVKDDKLAFFVWLTYIKYGNVMRAMSYEDQPSIFDRIKATCGLSFPVDHSVYEMIFAHLSRKTDDITIPFRNTNMKCDWRRINLSDVAHASRSTSARVIGAYFKEGLNSALTRPNESNSTIEDMLRQ